MALPPITRPDMIGSGHNSPEAWMMWEQLGHVGNSESGEGYQRVQKTNESQYIDTTNSPYIYIGYAIPGTATSEAKWKIKRVDTTTISILWANGTAFYSNVWDDRTSISYS
jgi:hypothetical protein